MKSKIHLSICLLAISALLIGCNGESTQSNSTQGSSGSSSHPKLYKPKTFTAAIQRLKGMHESLMADGEFPAPVTIEYVEVLHGEGASAHSHFYPAASYEAHEHDDEHDDDHSDRHSEEGETVKHHSMEVNLRTELTDVTTWLPKIAAKSNLSETDWNSVDSISSQINKLISELGAGIPDSEFRESWKLKSDEIETMLAKLQTICDSSGAAK